MAQIEAFQAIRYTGQDVSKLIAPPYDILSEEDKQALLRKDPRNIVAIDLPHTPPKSAGPDAVYVQAAEQLARWLAEGVLVRDQRPALYVYHQSYQLGGKNLVRKKFFARLRLEPFGSGSIFPHEQTFGGPKEDRLKLTTATRCNLSPIFGLYPDPRNEVAAALEAAIQPDRPEQHGTLDGVESRLWAVTDAAVISRVRGMLADKNIFIADGHHRYGTGWNYRQLCMDRMGPPPADAPVNFVLAVLGGMEDPGATIQPYFRSLAGLTRGRGADLQAALGEAFTWTPIPLPGTAEELAKQLAKVGPRALALYMAGENLCAVIAPKNADLLAAYEPERKAAWRQLPYAILHRYVIDEVLTPRLNDGRPVTIHYHKTMQEAIADARAEQGIGVLVPATTMSQLREICTAGELMPQKSTYFYPKLATGMVINPLY